MNDVMEYMGKSLVQYGEYSNRVYLLKLSREDFPSILEKLRSLSGERASQRL